MQSETATEILGETPKVTGETPVLPDPATGRLSVPTVERLQRLLGGDARVEGMILQFIAAKYGAASLLALPPAVAREILKRPADFIRAAKNYCEPELLAEGHQLFRTDYQREREAAVRAG